MKNRSNFMVVVLIAGLVLTGCAGTTKEYSAFAQAGAGYAAAVDKLFLSAGIAQIDSTSWTLVKEKSDTGMDEETYSKKNKKDRERIKEISRLCAHAKLLATYFGYLESLAGSDAPDKTKSAIEGVVASLDKLSSSLPTSTTALPPFGKLLVNLKIKAALKEELENRKDIIRNELLLQEMLLQKIAGDISHSLKLNEGIKEQRLVIDPLVSDAPLKNEDKWVSVRREVICMSVTVEEILSAGNAAKKMREAFEGLLSGEDSLGRINGIIMDMKRVLDVIDTINS